MKTEHYTTIDDITNLNIDSKIKEIFKKLINKEVYFDNNGKCQIGTLIGLERNYDTLDHYYIISVNNQLKYIPIWTSLSKL